MPELNGISVVGTSAVTYWSVPSSPNKLAAITPHISNYFDFANFHLYDAGNANWKFFPGSYYDLSKNFFDTIRKNKPWVVTEVGYENALNWNLPSSPGYQEHSYHYISELAAGKYYSVLFMELFKRGAQRVYTYEFIDQNSADQSNNENNFGLLHTDGSEKPAFTVIKNTLAILKDTADTFVPVPLSFSLSGDTAGLRYSLYQKKNGTYYLAMWQGIDKGVCYDIPNFTDLPADSQYVKISLPHKSPQLKVYQPLNSENPLYSYTFKDTLTVNVVDHLLIVEIQGINNVTPLPVKLISFGAKRLNQDEVLLNWQSSDDQKNKGFDIEISEDAIHFATIGFTSAFTESNFIRNYNFKTKQPAAIYYRLRQTDYSGSFSYSPVRWVNGTTRAEADVKLTPNPVSDFAQLSINEEMIILIVDASGRIFYNQKLPAGNHTIDLREFPAGMYFIKAISNRSFKALKIIKL